MRIRRYSELIRLESFEERFRYLSLRGVVGASTFGFDRWLNQRLYNSVEWKQTRGGVILRDNGCDLGIDGFQIHANLFVHHMNPIAMEDIERGERHIFDPEYLITVSFQTHQAIHYGDESLLPRGPIIRQPGDTKLW